MPFAITTTHTFSAAHQLRMPDGSLEPLHGHNWQVSVTVGVERLMQPVGWVMDFHDLQHRVNEILRPMRNANLNDVSAFKEANPSAENVALYIGKRLELPKDVKLRCVEVWETGDCKAVYEP